MRPYLEFVGQIDTLTGHEVIWQPYTDASKCAPQGLSSMCFRDCDFWMTKTPLVHGSTSRITTSTHPCTSKFIANLNSFFGRVKKASLLTNWLFLVAGGRGRVEDFGPFFGEAAAVPGRVGDHRAECRRRAALTRRRCLESVPAVVHGKDPDARDLHPPNPRLDLVPASMYPYPWDQSHNILVSSFALIQIKSHSLKFHCTNNPYDLDITTQLGRCTTWPSTWARR
jgi:hypothetical protein